jgi:hypothetical protein
MEMSPVSRLSRPTTDESGLRKPVQLADNKTNLNLHEL